MSQQKKPASAAITIFGAKGDLTKRKLIPALYNLYADNHLPSTFAIFCVDFQAADDTAFKNDLLEGISEFSRSGKANGTKWGEFAAHLSYIQGDFMKGETFDALKERIQAFEQQAGRGTRMHYLAVAPRFIEVIADALCTKKLCNRDMLDRIVVEKPFGTDLDSARKLNRFLGQRFKERQIYHIDHYLGKEMVQNLMAFRFANYVFEPLWNRKFIDHVQISVAEEVSVGKRGGYYDSSGALRDMIQNHLLQLLCIVAMECPDEYEAEQIRDAKVKVLKSVRKYTSPEDVFKNVIRGQYTAGEINDTPRVGYREEEQVAPDSTTETFVASRHFIDNDRWKGVPFFLRTGKSMPRQSSLIVIQFKDSPHKIFKDDIVPNRLLISIQPELEISLLFESKAPGLHMHLLPVEMDFMYKNAYSESLPEAYEALLLDVLEGDATLFMRADQIEAAWKVVMPVLEAWKKYPRKQLHFYEAGTWGPVAANAILKPYSKEWFSLSPMLVHA